ncbi:MAG: hypothetical protein HOH58_12680 [Opitutaceae bacterium]|jgi:hypothetical protein|nr:hypothetical protein [Opitutaceae bacterium]
MTPRRTAIAAVVIVAVLVIGVWRSGPAPGDPAFIPGKQEPIPVTELEPSRVAEAFVEDPRFLVSAEEDPLIGLVGEGLNQIGGSIERDLSIVDEVLAAWQTNFPGLGNPVGLNVEITAALTGRNKLRLDLIPADHPAINEAGELCDRWGTPFIFHQISGDNMELRSAGSDRLPYSADDWVFNPVSPLEE